MKLRIATRRSPLALWQARHVSGLLRGLDEVDEVALVPIVTAGDRILDRTLAKIGGKGLFIKELEQALLDDRADLAVHSMKDVPAAAAAGFAFPAALQREDARDAIVGERLAGLREKAVVGTSSLRRQAQLLALRPDLVVRPVRGNVETRLAKLDRGEFDAIMLAVAGLRRLGLAARITEILAPAAMVPAPGQGIVGIECRAADSELIRLLGKLDVGASKTLLTAERAVAAGLHADCHSPLGAHATLDAAGTLQLTAMVASPDGRQRLSACGRSDAGSAEALAERIVENLTRQGAVALLRGLSP